jgi:hypothetical protein
MLNKTNYGGLAKVLPLKTFLNLLVFGAAHKGHFSDFLNKSQCGTAQNIKMHFGNIVRNLLLI